MKKIICLLSTVAILFSLMTFFTPSNASAEEDTKLSKEVVSSEIIDLEETEEQVANQKVQTLTEKEFNKYKAEGMYGENDTYEAVVNAFEESFENPVDNTKTEAGKISALAASTSLKGYVSSPGDILITNDTQNGSGVSGHAGIAIGNGYILEIRGKGKTMVRTSVSDWRKKYKKTNVYRVKTQSVAVDAARWAKANYWDKNRKPTYRITNDIYKTNPTYCSKVVWQAYYFGTGSKKVVNVPSSRFVGPYALRTQFTPTYKPARIIKEHQWAN